MRRKEEISRREIPIENLNRFFYKEITKTQRNTDRVKK